MTLACRTIAAARFVLGGLFFAMALSSSACRTARKPEVAEAPGASGAPAAPISPATPTEVPPPPPAEAPKSDDPEIAVKAVAEPMVLTAWAEPKALPEGGGQSQLLVRVQKKGGVPFPGVEVRFKTSTGHLYSGGAVLVTDRMGVTRDRLTTKKTATVTLNAGGTRHTFQVPVGG
jgi:hypothetical protein